MATFDEVGKRMEVPKKVVTLVRSALSVILIPVSLWWLISALYQNVLSGFIQELETGSRVPLAIALFILLFGTLFLCVSNFRKCLLRCIKTVLNKKWYLFGFMVISQIAVWLSFGAVNMGADQENIRLSSIDPHLFSDYLSRCSNNVFITFIYWLVRCLVPASWPESCVTMGMQFLNILALDGSIVLLYCALKKVSSRLADTAFVLFIMLFGFSGYIIIVYTDILSLPFTVVAISIGIDLLKTRRHLWCTICEFFVLGVVLYFGYQMKASSIIPCLCFLGCILLFPLRRVDIKKVVCCGCSLLIGIVCALSVFGLSINVLMKLNYDPEQSYPMSHFAVMGMIDRGGFNPEERSAVSQFETKEEKDEYSKSRIKSELSNYGFVGYFDFLLRKSAYTLEDGTFSFGEWDSCFSFENKSDGLSSLRNSRVAALIRDFYTPDNYKYGFLHFTEQIVYIFMVIGILFGAIFLFAKKEVDVEFGGVESLWFLLSLLGAVAFLMLFESGRGKYLIQFLPMFVTFASSGLVKLWDCVSSLVATDKGKYLESEHAGKI